MLVHAAGESSPGNLPDDMHAVVLAARSEEQLLAVSARLSAAGVAHRQIREPDAPWSGQLMALGCVPAPRSEVRRHLSSLPLLRELHAGVAQGKSASKEEVGSSQLSPRTNSHAAIAQRQSAAE